MQVQDDKTHTLKGKKHVEYNPSALSTASGEQSKA